jgi:1-pyrroline-5-carboxylate dehydrogenase
MRLGLLTTFQIYVYDDANYEKTLEIIDNTSPYALTGSM